jgi:hypothetical protein
MSRIFAQAARFVACFGGTSRFYFDRWRTEKKAKKMRQANATIHFTNPDLFFLQGFAFIKLYIRMDGDVWKLS